MLLYIILLVGNCLLTLAQNNADEVTKFEKLSTSKGKDKVLDQTTTFNLYFIYEAYVIDLIMIMFQFSADDCNKGQMTWDLFEFM